MSDIIKNLSFRFTVFENGWMYPSFWFAPEDLCKVICGWAMEYRTSESVNKLIEDISRLNTFSLPNNETITSNENHIYIREKDQVTFDMEFVTELKPVTIPIADAIYLFERYREWLYKYENCKIPGLIPRNKLDTWISVPRSAVKDDYWNNQE